MRFDECILPCHIRFDVQALLGAWQMEINHNAEHWGISRAQKHVCGDGRPSTLITAAERVPRVSKTRPLPLREMTKKKIEETV
jgi:hypothetical protein